MNDNARADLGKLILRLALGVLVLLHGIGKLKGGLEGITYIVSDHGVPGFIAYGVYVGEIVAPLMVLAGFYARMGALLIVVNMLAAIALVHMGELAQLNDHAGWALELQGMYLATALALALLGPGAYGINRK
ncbi:MAG: DoxX family protein [Xanthomonadales bacterium]|nr:DoxX family protein [Xanthomonadales bacterium]